MYQVYASYTLYKNRIKLKKIWKIKQNEKYGKGFKQTRTNSSPAHSKESFKVNRKKNVFIKPKVFIKSCLVQNNTARLNFNKFALLRIYKYFPSDLFIIISFFKKRNIKIPRPTKPKLMF